MAKRNQKPEVRKAQREQAVRAAKDQKKATVKKPAVKVHVISSSNYLFFSPDKVFHLPYPLRTRPRRRLRRQQRTLPRPDPAGLAASDKYFAVEFLWQFIQ